MVNNFLDQPTEAERKELQGLANKYRDRVGLDTSRNGKGSEVRRELQRLRKLAEERNKPVTASQAVKEVPADKKRRETPGPQVPGGIREGLEKAQTARGGQSKASERKATPGSYENAVARGRKFLKVTEGSEDDKLLKSALWMARQEDGSVDEDQVSRIYKRFRDEPGKVKQEVAEYKFKRDEESKLPFTREQYAKANELGQSEFKGNDGQIYTTEQVGRYFQGKGVTPVSEVSSEELQTRQIAPTNSFQSTPMTGEQLFSNIDKVTGDLGKPLGPVGEFLGQTLVGGPIKGVYQLGQGLADPELNPGERAGLLLEGAFNSIPAVGNVAIRFGGKVLKPLLSGLKVAYAKGGTGLVGAVKLARELGIDDDLAVQLAKQVRDNPQALDDVLADPRIAKFNPTEDVNYKPGETPDLVGMAKEGPQDVTAGAHKVGDWIYVDSIWGKEKAQVIGAKPVRFNGYIAPEDVANIPGVKRKGVGSDLPTIEYTLKFEDGKIDTRSSRSFRGIPQQFESVTEPIPGAGNNAVPNVPGKKEPWQMTKAEYMDANPHDVYGGMGGRIAHAKPGTMKAGNEAYLQLFYHDKYNAGPPQVRVKLLNDAGESLVRVELLEDTLNAKKGDIFERYSTEILPLDENRVPYYHNVVLDALKRGDDVSVSQLEEALGKDWETKHFLRDALRKGDKSKLPYMVKESQLRDEFSNLKNQLESAKGPAKKAIEKQMEEVSAQQKAHYEKWSPIYAEWQKNQEDAITRKIAEIKQGRNVNVTETPVIAAKPAVETPPKSPQTPKAEPEVLKPLGPGTQRITKARVNEYRASLGLPETAPGKRTWNVEIEKAVNEGFVDKALDTAKELDVKSRPMQTHEQLAAGIKLQELDDLKINADKAIADALDSGDEAAIIAAKVAASDIQADIDVLTRTLNKSGGTDVARSLASRRAYINTRLKEPRAYAVAEIGRPLTKTESDEVGKLVQEIERLKKEAAQAPAQRLRTELAPRISRPRKIDVSIEKATAEYNAAKARAAQASKQLAGKGKRGGAVNPFLFDVAYHGAKLQLLKGVRVLDDIIKAIRADAPDADEADILRAIDQADKDLRAPRAPSVKPNLSTLRKEISDAIELAENPDQLSYLEQIQKDLDQVLKTGVPDSPEAFDIADRVSRAKRSFSSGSSYGWDVVVRGDNAMRDPAFIKLRGQLKQADARLKSYVEGVKEAERRAALTTGQRVKEGLVRGLLNSRQMLTGPDISFGLRQGMSAFLQGHYRDGLRMMKRGVKSFVNKESFADIDAMVRGSRRYDEATAAGLDLTDFTAGQIEEDALAGFLGRDLLVKGKNINPYAASNRAYTAQANSIRIDIYTKLADAMESSGKALTGEEAKVLADFVNTMSGRTSWLSKDKGRILNGIAFAPKYALSRIEFLSGSPLVKAIKAGKEVGDMRLATTIGKEYLKFYGSVTALATVLQFGNEQGYWKADLDPRGTNFLKVGIKNEKGTITYFDLAGGYGSYFVAAYRTSAAFARAVQGAAGVKDPIKPIKNQEGSYTDNAGMALSGFVTNKTSPLLRAGISTVSGFDRKSGKIKEFGKEKSLGEIAAGTVTPISAQTAMEGKSDSQKLTDLETFRNFVIEFAGIGNQTTDLPKKKRGKG